MNALLRASLCGRGLARPNLLSSSVIRTSTTGAADDFLEKQKKLNRPLSPHLMIYKFQLPALMSISHRITGIGLTVGVYSIAAGALFMPGNFSECISTLQDMHISQGIIVPAKLLTSGAFFYHFFNGVRHLYWDTGKGFKMTTVYKTGSVVLALTAVSTLYATFCL